MKSPIEIFTQLGDRLRDFGSQAPHREVMLRACRENSWFSPDDICSAVDAIVSQMLCREKLIEWLAAYDLPVRKPRRVLIVMAGNIPLVGFFDMLCVLAAGHKCVVKPSSKDSVLIRYIADQLLYIEPNLSLEFCEELISADAVIATGSDNSNRFFRARYASTPALLRANRHSIAVLLGNETTEQLALLARDIWTYSGLGCRNVSLIFAPQGFYFELHPPAMNPKYRNNYLQHRALLTMSGRPFCDLGTAILVESPADLPIEFPTNLSEIRIVRYQNFSQVESWLTHHDQQLQCVVGKDINNQNWIGFGSAQYPKLTDYPDREDVMAFVSQLD